MYVAAEKCNKYNSFKTNLAILVLFFFLPCSEKASLAVTLVNANNEVMGHAAFFDYPNVPSLDPAKWEEWFHLKYNCKCNVSIPLVLHE